MFPPSGLENPTIPAKAYALGANSLRFAILNLERAMQ